MGADSNATSETVSGLSGQTHTPGPWKVDMVYSPEAGEYIPSSYIVDARGINVAAALFGAVEEPQRAANARLIAAAPTMKEALEEAEQVLDQYADLQDDSEGGSHPNAAARALQTVRNALKGASS